MPFYHKKREFTPLLIAAERKAKKNGLRHAIYTSKFDKYIGDWKNDLKDGMGRFLTIQGKLYEGEWYKGRRWRAFLVATIMKCQNSTELKIRVYIYLPSSKHGFGILSQRQPNGMYSLIYRGDWVRGKPEGIGWRYFDNGDIYMGFWKGGLLQGYGNYWYTDNTFYAGYFKNDLREGFGLLLFENGDRYEGHWEKGVKSGIGRFYHMRTGQLQEGCWANDVCFMSKITDILIRQACDHPTPYPIPPHKLKYSRAILEFSELWTKQKKGEIEKNLKLCIDQM